MLKGKIAVLVPILIITVGVGWLLNSLGALPGVNWAWTLLLGTVGLVTLATGGINKVTVVIGPFLLIASVLSVMRQTGRLSINVEVPCLVIALGVLLLISMLSSLPAPDWILPAKK